MGEGVVRIAGHEQHFDIGVLLYDLILQLAAAHLWHYHVGQKHVNRFVIGFTDSKCCLAVCCLQHLVAVACQNLSNQTADYRLILDNENGLGPRIPFRPDRLST